MRAVTKREVWGESEDGKQNVLLLYSERASHLPTTKNLLAAIVTKYFKQQTNQFYSTQVWKGWSRDVVT